MANFKQIPEAHLILGYEEAYMIAVIESWSTNSKKKGEHFMSQEEYCKKYHLKHRRYFTIIKKLKDHGIIEVVRRLTNNRQVLRINQSELEYVLDKGYNASSALPPCTPCTTTMHNMHSNNASDAPLECTIDTTHIPDKIPNKVTIENTIESTKPVSFSFDDFKAEVKQNDIDPMILSLAMDFDKDF